MQVELTKAEFDNLMAEQQKDENPGVNDDIEIHHLSRAAWTFLRNKPGVFVAGQGQFSPKLWTATSITNEPIYCLTTRHNEQAVFH